MLNSSLVEAVKNHGFEVENAFDGEEGLKKAKETSPDLILLDVMMPKLDGISVLWELKAQESTSKIPVIILTNSSDTETISKIMQTGTSDYLLKSEQSIEQIVQKIKDVLNRSKGPGN